MSLQLYFTTILRFCQIIFVKQFMYFFNIMKILRQTIIFFAYETEFLINRHKITENIRKTVVKKSKIHYNAYMSI